jgi:hypothetical protein
MPYTVLWVPMLHVLLRDGDKSSYSPSPSSFFDILPISNYLHSLRLRGRHLLLEFSTELVVRKAQFRQRTYIPIDKQKFRSNTCWSGKRWKIGMEANTTATTSYWEILISTIRPVEERLYDTFILKRTFSRAHTGNTILTGFTERDHHSTRE